VKLLALLIPIVLVQIPYDINAVECHASIAAKSVEELTVFTFRISNGCPDIYGFYLTPTTNDDIIEKSSPQGWFGGGDKNNFVIWTTHSNPVRSGDVSEEFIVVLLGSGLHELNWSIADENLMPVYWGKIVIENSR
jgi:hypothetical protein